MASTSRAREKSPEKIYVHDDESDDEVLDFTHADFEPEIFKPTCDKVNDPFLSMLCDENMGRGTDWYGEDEGDDVVEKAGEQGHFVDENVVEVGAEYRVHDPSLKWNLMKPHVGELYESPAQLRFALTNYAVANGYQLRFVKSDRHRLIAKCGDKDDKKPCPFRLYATWMYSERSFQIKNMVETHLCARNFNFGCLVSCNWLAKHYLKDIIRKPKMTLTQMKEDILARFSINVSKGQCHRARVRAREMFEGKLEEHYAKIWDYAQEILRSNPGSTCKVGVSVNPDGRNYFQRFYVCFKSFRDGWNRGCRRVVGLDGCFLKGQIKGELLTAIGRDADNHVYPIAWAVVNIENKDNWTWFLELLADDLGVDGGRGMVVISDQHKGLLEAVKIILPHVEHRQCARHIYANFRKVYSGVEYKNMFWAAATSTVEGDFLAKMEEIKRVSPRAYDWLMARNPQSWCQAYFSQGYACEAVENGVSESFNAMIVDIRKKPLLTMLEEIRLYLMERFYYMASEHTKWNSEFTPASLEKMKEFGLEMRHWKVFPSGGNVFETRNGYSSYKVDLDGAYCTCRLWELSGIPCVHAQAAINYKHSTPSTFINGWFSKEKYIAAYASNILPLNGSNMWPKTDYIEPLPPLVRRMPGRPKTKRIRHVSEKDQKFPTVRVKVRRTLRCTKCLQEGHNRKSCKNEEKAKEPMSRHKTGRPRRDAFNQKQPEAATTDGTRSNTQNRQANNTVGTRQKLPCKRGGLSGRKGKRVVQGQTSKKKPVERGFTNASEVFSTQNSVNFEGGTSFGGSSLGGTSFKGGTSQAGAPDVENMGGGMTAATDVGTNLGGTNVGGTSHCGIGDVDMDYLFEATEVDFQEGPPEHQVRQGPVLHHMVVSDLEASGYLPHEIAEALQGATILPEPMEQTEMVIEATHAESVEEDGGDKEIHKDAGGRQTMKSKTRCKSERIMKNKLKNAVYDKDGGGSSMEKAISLE